MGYRGRMCGCAQGRLLFGQSGDSVLDVEVIVWHCMAVVIQFVNKGTVVDADREQVRQRYDATLCFVLLAVCVRVQGAGAVQCSAGVQADASERGANALCGASIPNPNARANPTPGKRREGARRSVKPE